MPAMLTLLTLLGATFALAFVLAPLRKGSLEAQSEANEAGASTASSRTLTGLLEQREAALAGLAELDFDRKLGNLSDDDYQNLRAHYRAQAIDVLKALDARGVRQIAPQGTITSHRDTLARTGPAVTTQPQSKNLGRGVLWLAGGASLLAAVAILLWSALLRGNAAPVAEEAQSLGVMHAHAALLVPGTRVGLIGHHGGLLRSEDDGRTWSPVGGVTGDVLSLAGAPDGGSTLYLATSVSVLRSRDAGLTWEPLAPPPGKQIQAIALGEGAPAPLYASVSNVGVYRTKDMRAWEIVGGSVTENTAALVMRPGPLGALYAGGPEDGVLASGDEGRTWGSASGVLNGVLPTFAVRALAFDPQSGDTSVEADGAAFTGAMYAGTDLGLFKTINGGGSWSELPLRQSLAAVAARSLPDPLILAVDSRGRLWRSLDRGGSWSGKP